MYPKNADGMANSVDPDQTVPSDLDLYCLNIFIVCPKPYVIKFYNQMFSLCHVTIIIQSRWVEMGLPSAQQTDILNNGSLETETRNVPKLLDRHVWRTIRYSQAPLFKF